MSSPTQVYLGIDPGQDGGIAMVNVATRDSGRRPVLKSAIAMPETERDVWETLRAEGESAKACMAIIEKVHSFPKQGVASTFKFGVGYGGLRMALTASRIPFEVVLPKVWQRGLGIPARKKNETNSRWKNRLKGMAQQLFPNADITLKTADAILIAEYCRRKDGGLL